MDDYKDVSQVTESVLARLYFLRTQDDPVRVLVTLYMRLNEEDKRTFLQLVAGKEKLPG